MTDPSLIVYYVSSFAEPEKLQIIQQYLKSSTNKLTEQNVTSGESITSVIPNDEPDLIAATGTTMTMNVDAFTMAAFLNGEASFPESVSPTMEAETETTTRNSNATRYCDDCFEGEEVCVALVNEEVPICRSPRDREDPTGCAGLCIINKQKCHRLDVDAFRFVDLWLTDCSFSIVKSHNNSSVDFQIESFS